MKNSIIRLGLVMLMVLGLSNMSFAYDMDDDYDYEEDYENDDENDYNDFEVYEDDDEIDYEIDEECLYSGPGVGLDMSTFINLDRIYTTGLVTGIEGCYVSNSNTRDGIAPKYVDMRVNKPIDNSLIDMGPKSASNVAYSLHKILDGGPGTDIESNELGSNVIYNDNGPGQLVVAMSYTEEGPKTTITNVDPSDYLRILALGPTSGEKIPSKKNRNK